MNSTVKSKYPRWLIWSVVISDIVLINLAFLLAYYLRYEIQLLVPVDPAFDNPPDVYFPFMIVLTAILLISFKLDGVYMPRRLGVWLDQMSLILRATTMSILLMIGVVFFYRPFFYSRLIFLYASVLILALLGLGRLVWGIILAKMRQRGIGVARVLVVGAGDVGRTVIRTVMAQPELGYRIVALVDDHFDKSSQNIGPILTFEGTHHVPQIVDEQHVDEVVVAWPWSNHQKIVDIIQVCDQIGVRARTVPDIFQLSLNRVDVEDLGGVPLIGLKTTAIRGTNLLIKRVIDLTLGGLVVIISLPFMAILAVAVKLDLAGPVIFKQKRIGMHGCEFVAYKFRSMKQGAEEEQSRLLVYNEATGPLFKMRDDPRMTRVGRFLRKTSLDELPQLFNMIRGDMSLVGPRPHTPSEVAQYEDWHKQVFEAPPGLTGLPQVSGRSQLSFDEQCLLDIYYIENWSPALDLKIILRTIPKMLSGEGAY